MRFTTVIPSVLFVALLALTNVVAAESQAKNNVALTSDNVEAELMYEYFEKRAEDVASNGTETSSVEPIATAIETATKTSNGSSAAVSGTATASGKHGSSTTSAASSAATTKAAKAAKAKSPFLSVPILTRGDLFYLGVAVTLFLWCTGKAIDVKIERQEKYAESRIHSI